MRTFQAVLATSLPVDTSGRAQLLPAGEFAARDGRPGPGRKWKLDDARGAAIAASITAVAALTPVVIDYDHQTLFTQANGQQAPASGWIRGAEWLSGQGLFAQVEWTAAAKARIEAKEYRYISPVITYAEDGTVTSVALAALCNFPALLGMEAVVAHLTTQNLQETAMNPTLIALIAALGLAATTTEADALSAVKLLRVSADELKARPALPAALGAELGLAAGADEAAALGAVQALKAAKPDAATVQLVAQLQGQLATLTAQVQGDKVTQVVDAAIDGGKLVAAQREQYLSLGRKDFAMLTSVLAVAPVIPGLKGQHTDIDTSKGGEGAAALTASQRLIAKQLALDPTAYAKTLADA